MEHRRTESNVIESEPEEESEVESEIVRNVEDPDVCVDDSELELPKSRQQMSVKRKKMSIEDNILQMLESRKVENPVSSFLMSLAPQIRKLCEEKQNQVLLNFYRPYKEFLLQILTKVHIFLRQIIMFIPYPYNTPPQLSMTVLITHIRPQ